MKKISVQALDSLFNFLNREADKVLWIRDKEYKRQIYINDKFEEIWQMPVDLLYENPRVFDESLLPEERPKALEDIERRLTDAERSGIVLFKARDAKGNVKFLRDHSFMLLDIQGEHVGYLGLGQELSEQQWRAEMAMKAAAMPSPDEQIKKQVFSILRKELHLDMTNNVATPSTKLTSVTQNIKLLDKGKEVILTEREQQCLYHLVCGKSAKLTASLLNISTRTVEFHINNIKEKTSCRTKLQLLGKVISQ